MSFKNTLLLLGIHVRSPGWQWSEAGPLFTKSRSREIGCYDDRIALKFDRYIDGAAGEDPVKFLAASRFHKILR